MLLFPIELDLGWLWNDVDSIGPIDDASIENCPIVDTVDMLLWCCSSCVSLGQDRMSVQCLMGSCCSFWRCWRDSGMEEFLEKGSWKWIWNPQGETVWHHPLVVRSILVKSLERGEEMPSERKGHLGWEDVLGQRWRQEDEVKKI